MVSHSFHGFIEERGGWNSPPRIRFSWPQKQPKYRGRHAPTCNIFLTQQSIDPVWKPRVYDHVHV